MSWHLPPLSDGKKGRIMTKHFTNLSFLLPANLYSLLSFLIYQSAADNTIQYSIRLLEMYDEAVTKGSEIYGTVIHVNTSIPNTHKYFKKLCELGLLIRAGKKWVINPNLTYSKLYVKPTFYNQWVQEYQNETKEVMAEKFINHVQESFKQRKKSL